MFAVPLTTYLALRLEAESLCIPMQLGALVLVQARWEQQHGAAHKCGEGCRGRV